MVKSELAECHEAKLALLGAEHLRPTHPAVWSAVAIGEPSCNLSLLGCLLRHSKASLLVKSESTNSSQLSIPEKAP